MPVRLAFAVFGVFWGTWAVGALDVQAFLGLSDQGLGLLVAATVAGTTVTNVVGGTLAERRGPQRAMAVSLWIWGPLVLAVAAVGLALASIGAATYWPLLTAVANGASDRPALAVGGASAAGYLGFLAGPVLVGVVADRVDLRAGVLVLAAVGLAGASIPLRSLARR